MKLRPIANRVIIKRDDAVAVTSSGIIISDSAKEVPIQGTILRIGDTVTRVKDGDRVMFGRFAGTDLKVDGTEVLMMREEDILGVIES